MNEHWDARYRSDEYIYGVEPNVWLKSCLETLTPGRILFPAEGEGRNAVFAAGRGWEVYAFDQSAMAKRKALKLAEEHAVGIDYQVAHALDYQFSVSLFDAVAFIYAHFSASKRLTITQKILQHVKPGGAVVFEAFSREQLKYQEKYSSGGPKDPEMLYSLDEVKKEFAALEFEYLAVEEVRLSEGLFHAGPSSVIRFKAKVPA